MRTRAAIYAPLQLLNGGAGTRPSRTLAHVKVLINGRQPVRAGWSQLRAVRSISAVAAKMRASLMVEAELLVEGQVVLDGDGCDVYLALARRLAHTCSGGRSGCQQGSSPCSVGQEATKRPAHWERRVSSLHVCDGLSCLPGPDDTIQTGNLLPAQPLNVCDQEKTSPLVLCENRHGAIVPHPPRQT